MKEVTTNELGLHKDEVVFLALLKMHKQGGAAMMSQIIREINIQIKKSGKLSQQGEASLRQYINDYAVKKGFIYKYTKTKPGWFITPKGIEHLREKYTHLRANSSSVQIAIALFYKHIEEVETLVSILKQSKGTGSSNKKTLSRIIWITLTTSWEGFLKDIIEEYTDYCLLKHPKKNDISKYVSENFCQDLSSNNFKNNFRNKREKTLKVTSSMRHKKFQELTILFFGEDFSSNWTKEEREMLEKVIDLRNTLSHRSLDYFETKSQIGIPQINAAIKLIIDLGDKLVTSFSNYEESKYK